MNKKFFNDLKKSLQDVILHQRNKLKLPEKDFTKTEEKKENKKDKE